MDEIIDDPREQPQYRFKNIFKLLWFIYGFMSIIGYIFKIMHWPGADTNMILGFTGISGHCIVYILYRTKDKTQKRFGYLLPVLLFMKAFSIYHIDSNILFIYLGFTIIAFVISFLLRK